MEVEQKSAITRLYVFNVGQGEHLLIEFPNDTYGIIDFYYNEGVSTAFPPALTFLDSLLENDKSKVIKIAFLCISHPDYDHVKGLELFYSWFKRGFKKERILMDELWCFAGLDLTEFMDDYRQVLKDFEKSKTYKSLSSSEQNRVNHQCFSVGDDLNAFIEMKEFAKRRGIAVTRLSGPAPISPKRWDNIKAICIGPLSTDADSFSKGNMRKFLKANLKLTSATPLNRNKVSSVIAIGINNKFQLLFTGDSGLNELNKCLKRYMEIDTINGICPPFQFVKGAHHGSSHSSSPDLWKLLLGELHGPIITVSSGKPEIGSYRHPTKKTLADLKSVSQATGKPISLFCTCTCSSCLENISYYKGKEPIGEMDMDVHFKYQEKRDERVDMALQHLRIPQTQKKPDINLRGLLCYVFELDPGKSDITVYKGTSKLAKLNQCILNADGVCHVSSFLCD